MKAFEIKLCWIVRDSMKSACCSVLKDQWLAIVVGFVILTIWLKSIGFHGQTTEAWEFVDAIRSKKVRTSRSDFCVRFLFCDPLGIPFDRLLQTPKVLWIAKKNVSVRPNDICLKEGSPKSVLAAIPNFSLGPKWKKVWGGSSFYGRKVGYPTFRP